MQRFLNYINKEVNGLHQAAFLLASASIGAKILAILRDRLLASSFGAGKTLDIYYASFRLPDLLYVASLFLVSITALIPIFLDKKDKKEKKEFINIVFSASFIIMVVSVVILFFITPFLVGFVAPGFTGEDSKTLINLSRILLLSPLFLGFSNLVSSVIQSFRRFFAYALSGVFYNLGIILGILFFYPKFGINGVALGVILGALLHFLVQVPSLVRLGFFPVFTTAVFKKSAWIDIKKVFRLSFPRTLGLTLNQVVLTVVTALASVLTAGSITVFNLASNLQAIPLGVIALSYSVAAFPSLAKSHLQKEKERFLSLVVSSFRHILFWLLPATVLFIILRAQIVRVVLGSGAFTWTDTRLTAASLALFALSLFAQGLILLLVRAFYAAGKTKLPLILNIISSIFIIIFSVGFLFYFKYSTDVQNFFSGLLRVDDVVGVSVLALPLAFSLGTILNFFLLYYFFQKEFGKITHFFKKSLIQIKIATLVVGLVAYFGLQIFSCFFNLDTFLGIFMQGFLAGTIALFAGFLVLRLFKNEELIDLTKSFKKKFLSASILRDNTEVVAKPEPEELP
ncbi:murein biosynthesis integral membrane protein MurJ [Patescibacteria group bacterium]